MSKDYKADRFFSLQSIIVLALLSIAGEADIDDNSCPVTVSLLSLTFIPCRIQSLPILSFFTLKKKVWFLDNIQTLKIQFLWPVPGFFLLKTISNLLNRKWYGHSDDNDQRTQELLEKTTQRFSLVNTLCVNVHAHLLGQHAKPSFCSPWAVKKFFRKKTRKVSRIEWKEKIWRRKGD